MAAAHRGQFAIAVVNLGRRSGGLDKVFPALALRPGSCLRLSRKRLAVGQALAAVMVMVVMVVMVVVGAVGLVAEPASARPHNLASALGPRALDGW